MKKFIVLVLVIGAFVGTPFAFIGVAVLGGNGKTKPNTQVECVEGAAGALLESSAPKSGTEPTGADAIPSNLPPIYHGAERKYHVPWYVLAGVNRIETDFGRNLNVSSAGAIGWMQFEPGTWRQYGVDANGDGKKDAYNPKDAIYGAANLLRASGMSKDGKSFDVRKALFAYNHANWYVDEVLQKAELYHGGSFVTTTAVDTGEGCTDIGDDYAGNGSASFQAIKDAADALNAKHVPYSYGGGHVTPARPSPGRSGIGMDCSASISWVLQKAGFKIPTMVSGHGGFMDWGRPGVGRVVTIYAYSGHVIMKIGGRWFGTSGFGHPQAGTGAAWFTKPVPEYYLDLYGFVARHPPSL